MSLPYFPMFPKDFEAKTSHLTLAEDGAYNRLLRLMWMTSGCTLPADPAWLIRRLRVSSAEFDEVVRPVIDEFFVIKKGRLTQPNLARIYDETSVAHQKRVNAGSMGGKAKALNARGNGSSNAKAMLKQPEPEPEPEPDKKEREGAGARPAVARKSKQIDDVEVIGILSIAASQNVAAAFVQHRRDLKRAMTANAANAMIKKLEGHPNPDAVLTDSIANGWQGIFPEKTKGQANGRTTDRDQRRQDGFDACNEIADAFGSGKLKHEDFR